MRFFSFQNNLFIDSCAISSHYQDIDLATMFIFAKWTFYQPQLKIFSWNLSWHYHSILEIVRQLKSLFQGTPMYCVHINIFLPRCLTFTSLHILYSFKLSSASLDQNSALFSALSSAHHASRISVLFCWLQYHFNFNNNDQQIKSHALHSYIFRYIFLDMSSKF